ncbi:MAG: AAA family ATPase [Planctomycetaceae bacterium]
MTIAATASWTDDHRLLQKIEREHQAGHRHFLVECQPEEWFYNPWIGVRSLEDSIAIALLRQQQFQIRKLIVPRLEEVAGPDVEPFVVYVASEDSRELVTKKKSDSLQKALTGRAPQRSGAANSSSKSNAGAETTPQNAVVTAEADKFYSDLRACVAGLNSLESKGDVAVLLPDFQTAAQLYTSPGTETRNYVRLLEQLWRSPKIMSFVVLNSVDPLRENFLGNLDKQVCIVKPGPPGPEELQRALLRRSGCDSRQIPALRRFALLMAHHRKSLREVLTLFATMYRQEPDSFLDENRIIERMRQHPGHKIEHCSWDDVVLSAERRSVIEGTWLAFREDCRANRQPRVAGLLLHGPPGTGKTLVAKTLASETGAAFFSLTVSSLKAQYVGQSAPRVSGLFEAASQVKPAIIFIDEIESILPSRGHENADSFTRDIVAEILPLLDGTSQLAQGIFIVGATNRVELIDAAALSRLRAVEISLPTAHERIQILRKQLGLNNDTKDYVEELLSRLARMTAGMAGRDLRKLAQELTHGLSTPTLSQSSIASNNSSAVVSHENALLLETRCRRRCEQHWNDKFQGFAVTEFISNCPGFSRDIWPDITRSLLKFAKYIDDPSRFTAHGLRPWSRLQLRCCDRRDYSPWFARVVAAESRLPLLTIHSHMLQSADQARRLLQLVNETSLVQPVLVHIVPQSHGATEDDVLQFIQLLDPHVSVIAWMDGSRLPQSSPGSFDESISISGPLSPDAAAVLLKETIAHAGISLDDHNIDWLDAAKSAGISRNAVVDSRVQLALRRAIRDASDYRKRIPLQPKHFKETPEDPSP